MKYEVPTLVVNLLVGDAPEREAEILDLCTQLAVTFDTAQDRPGFVLEAGAFGLVLFTPRTMHIVWMLGFAAWRAFQTYGWMFLILSSGESSRDWPELAQAPGQEQVEENIRRIVEAAAELKAAPTQESFRWPGDVPFPEEATVESVEDAVARDLVHIAGGFVFFHELHHLMLSDSAVPPLEEEMRCDAFAAGFLLGKAVEYAEAAHLAPEKVIAKRAMGIMVGLFVVMEVTPLSRWPGSSSHPAIKDRVGAFLARLPITADSYFWSFGAALILGKLRLEGKGPGAMEAHATQKGLCLSLVAFL